MESKMLEQQRQSVLEMNSSHICIHLGEMRRSIVQLQGRNRKKWDQILRNRPDFEYRLIKVNENQTLSKAFSRELLLRQMDRLLEEQNFLDRELSLIRFRDEEKEMHKEELLSNGITPYQALRSVWKRNTTKFESSIDHIESLNEAVGHIKHSLKKIMQIQGNSSEQSQSEYLKYYAIERCAAQTCNNCASLQQSKNQLRGKQQNLQRDFEELTNKAEEYRREISKKDEQIRKLTTKMMERETEAHKKLVGLEDKLISSEYEVRQLRRFKEDLERNSFFNQEENYQVFIYTDRDLADFTKCISLELNCLLDLLAENQIGMEESGYCIQGDLQFNQMQSQFRPREEQQFMLSTDFLIPELSFGTSEKQRQKNLTKKSSMTDRPRTERIITFGHKLQSIEQLEISSKKYLRTNQLTTKRINRPLPLPYFDSQHTVKLNDSPKNGDESNR